MDQGGFPRVLDAIEVVLPSPTCHSDGVFFTVVRNVCFRLGENNVFLLPFSFVKTVKDFFFCLMENNQAFSDGSNNCVIHSL